MDVDLNERLRAYARYHEAMTEKTCVLGAKYFVSHARFSDPLCELTGKQAISDLYTDRRRRCATYRFKIIDSFWGADGQTAYWRWDKITSDLRGVRTIVSGMSEITFDLKGHILAQVDYFNALGAIENRSPFAGWLIRKFS